MVSWVLKGGGKASPSSPYVRLGFFGITRFMDDMGNPSPSDQGLLSAAISFGYIIGFLPSSWIGDRFGRRLPQLAGSLVVIIGVIVQVVVVSKWAYFGARIIIGIGAAFPLTLGSTREFVRRGWTSALTSDPL